jgi:hypothetical protein
LAWTLLLGEAIALPVPLKKRFDAGRAGFSVRIGNTESDYRVAAPSVLPGGRLDIEASVPVSAYPQGGGIVHRPAKRWTWRAPDAPGLYPLILIAESGRRMTLNVFVMRPASEVPKSYPMGRYPRTPYRGLSVYNPPSGFLEVTEDMRDVSVSPHFTLGQFFCKEPEGWPKYLALEGNLTLKLEALLEEINRAGVRADSLTVMSGYRTPHYNASIRNGKNSRHIYGGAADVFVDVSPQDGVMDDVNKDGRTDRKDASFLYDLAEAVDRRLGRASLIGGLGEYDSTDVHGPFIHIDARGYEARWGR